MRIRKHASKLLASVLVPQSATAPPPPASTASLAAATSANGFSAAASAALPTHHVPLLDVCELNRSPWDVIPSSPSEDEYLQRIIPVDKAQNHVLPQEGGEREDDGSATVGNGSGILGRKRAPPPPPPAATRSPPLMVPEDEAENEKMEREVNEEERRENDPRAQALRQRKQLLQNKGRKKSSSSSSKKNSMRSRKQAKEVSIWAAASAAVEVEGGEEKGSCASAAISKKSEGKGWHCKMETKHPYNYGLSQIRGYYSPANPLQSCSKAKPSSTDGFDEGAELDKTTKTRTKTKTKTKKKNPPLAADSKSSSLHRRKKPANLDAPDFYYYYSGFGPWRGKPRGGGVESKHVEATDDIASEAVVPPPPITTTVVGYAGWDDVADDDNGLDPESIDDVEDSSEGDVGPSRIKRRKGRKPIKARSLKSLL